jgi:hypothetical protein
MPDTTPVDPTTPIKLPVCPDCRTCMRLDRASPDNRYRNLHHMIFICECGRTTDQLIAMPE